MTETGILQHDKKTASDNTRFDCAIVDYYGNVDGMILRFYMSNLPRGRHPVTIKYENNRIYITVYRASEEEFKETHPDTRYSMLSDIKSNTLREVPMSRSKYPWMKDWMRGKCYDVFKNEDFDAYFTMYIELSVSVPYSKISTINNQRHSEKVSRINKKTTECTQDVVIDKEPNPIKTITHIQLIFQSDKDGREPSIQIDGLYIPIGPSRIVILKCDYFEYRVVVADGEMKTELTWCLDEAKHKMVYGGIINICDKPSESMTVPTNLVEEVVK